MISSPITFTTREQSYVCTANLFLFCVSAKTLRLRNRLLREFCNFMCFDGNGSVFLTAFF